MMWVIAASTSNAMCTPRSILCVVAEVVLFPFLLAGTFGGPSSQWGSYLVFLWALRACQPSFPRRLFAVMPHFLIQLAPSVRSVQLLSLWTYGTWIEILFYCPGPLKPGLGGNQTSNT